MRGLSVALFGLFVAVAVGEVLDLTDANFEDTVKAGGYLVKFYAPWCGHCKSLAPTWDHLGKELAGKANIAKVDCTKEKDTCGKFGVRGYPTLKYIKDGEEVEQYKSGRDAASFVKFLKEKGELSDDVEVKPLVEKKAAPKKEAPKEPAGPTDVTELTADNFKEKIASGYHLIKFYAPWCGHCKKLAPTWDHLATQLKGKTDIAKIDCTVHSGVCSDFGVRGYPTIKLFKDGEEVEKYAGGRDADSFVKYLKEQGALDKDVEVKALAGDKPAPKKVEKPAEPEAPSDVKVLTADNFKDEVASGYHLIKFYAPWCGHCKRLVPTWDHLATQLKGKTNIAKLDCTAHQSVCGDNGVRGYPTIKLFKDGEEVEKYAGGRDADSFVKYLKEQGAVDKDVEVKAMGSDKPAPKKVDPAPAIPEKTNVVILTEDDFATKTAEGAWLIKFYAPWCGHCKKMAPAWEELATNINGKSGSKVNIAKVDCTTNQSVCKDKGVRGYPTIKLLVDGADEPYQGGRDVASVTTFLEGKELFSAAAPAKDEL